MKLLTSFVLKGLFLRIFISISLGPLAKIADSPCIELRGLDSAGQLGPTSASSRIYPLETTGLKSTGGHHLSRQCSFFLHILSVRRNMIWLHL